MKKNKKAEFHTKYMQIGPSTDWRHTAAAENGLALVEAGIAHHRAEDGQSTVEIAQTAGHQYTILTPWDAQLDKRSTHERTQSHGF